MRLGDWRESVPDGYRVAAVDADFLGSGKKNVREVLGWVEGNWLSQSDFLSNCFGFCIIHGEAIVTSCLPDCVSGERCEIGINTEVGYRRRGLAALTVAATVSYCLDNGVGSIGWRCLANNSDSRRTDKKVGRRGVGTDNRIRAGHRCLPGLVHRRDLSSRDAYASPYSKRN